MTMQTLYTGPTAEDLAHIPAALTTRSQWVLWRGADRVEQETGEITGLEKIPIDPQTLRNASTTDPETWGTFKQCVAALPGALEEWENDDPGAYRGGGIGYVFSHEDPYTGIDLDHCRDPTTRAIADWAQAYIDTLASYTEVTPSGTGVHILVQGALPPRGRRKGAVEMYAYARFFTMTGWHLAGTPPTIAARQAELTALHSTVFGPQQSARQHSPTQASSAPLLEDAVLLDKARAAQNGTRFTALWSGDITGYDSPSNADLALCVRLAFWTQDPAQIDRLFRQSGLLRDKWDEKRGTHTYGERTIMEGLARQTEHYQMGEEAQRRRNGQAPLGTPDQAAAIGSKVVEEDSRPVIRISTEMTAVVDAMQQAILEVPSGPVLFQRARRLCHITRGRTPPDWLDRALDAPVIAPAAPAYLRELASQTAQWQKLDKRANRWEPALPPPWTVETLQARASWPFPPLTGIVHAPTMRPDGSLLTTPGYDAATGLYLDTGGVNYPKVRSRPTLDDARSAIGHLQEAFCDFPWAHKQHDFSATLAALLSLVARYAIQGNVPLFAVRSTTRASGKGLLVDTISIIATGRHAPRWAQTLDEDEEHKRLVTVGLAGDLTIHIDNVAHPLGTGPLDLAITAETISGRILGTQKEIEVPMHVVFFASGNNMVFKGDMARRVVPIDLDPRMERPEERDNFTHPLLLSWVLEKRPRLLAAALTILRAYVEAGRPAQGVKPLGSFEQWSMLVRQALLWAGEPDPCAGRQNIEAESDENFEKFASLLETWYVCYQTTAKTLASVIYDASSKAVEIGPRNEWNDLRDALGAFDAKYDGKRPLGKPVSYALRAWKGRVIASKRLVSAGKEHHAAQWQIELF